MHRCKTDTVSLFTRARSWLQELLSFVRLRVNKKTEFCKYNFTQLDTSQRTGSRRRFSWARATRGCPTVQCPTALPSPVRVSMSLLWTHLKFECLWVKLQNLEYWYTFAVFTWSLWDFRTLKHMTDSDKEPHGLWEVSLMLRLFPTEQKNNVLWSRPTSTTPARSVLSTSRPSKVGSCFCPRWRGSLGTRRVSSSMFLPEPDYTHYRTTCLETRSVETLGTISSQKEVICSHFT